MRLYIRGVEADLSEDSLVLYTWTDADLTEPAAVVNSYSRSLTLPGTPNNRRIFSQLDRADHVTAQGFDPLRRTPFEIYDSRTLLERGYVRLDQVKYGSDGEPSYEVTLYGGLGSFLYALTYAADGGKRTLASLTFRHNSSPVDVGFTIDRNAVKDAWGTLEGTINSEPKWNVINFAPMYNGLPDGEFEAKKAVIKPDTAGLPTSDGDYTTVQGYGLVTLDDRHTEWETHDLRSYLQRPVLKLSAIVEAMCDPAQNGGYGVSLEGSFWESPYYTDTWLTLPLLSRLSLGSASGRVALQVAPTEFYEQTSVHVAGPILSGVSTSAQVSFKPQIMLETSYTGTAHMCCRGVNGASNSVYRQCWLVQAVGYTKDSQIAGVSTVHCIEGSLSVSGQQQTLGPSAVGQIASYTPIGGASYETTSHTGTFACANGYATWNGSAIELAVSGNNIAYMEVAVTPVTIVDGALWTQVSGGLQTSLYALYRSNSTTQSSGRGIDTSALALTDTGDTYIDFTTFVNARSGSRIEASVLLGGTATPADYLIGLVKMFGLSITLDKDSNSVVISDRASRYGGSVDLTERVDMGADRSMRPNLLESKWYDWGVESHKTAFSEYVKKLTNRGYGVQRVNTGYEFSSESKTPLKDVVFRTAPEVRKRSKYHTDITDNSKAIPSVFLNTGAKLSLYHNGESKDIDISCPSSDAVITYWDDVFLCYDWDSRLELCAEDGKAVDGPDVMLFFRGMKAMEGSTLTITDDAAVMDTLNEGTPTWWLNAHLEYPDYVCDALPSFGRYEIADNAVTRSLDHGTPPEVDIPGITLSADAGVYARAWAAYLGDRYDKDARVLSVTADMRGIQVGQVLLGRFVHALGCVWVINRIEDWDPQGDRPARLELVRVTDTEAYVNGQNY